MREIEGREIRREKSSARALIRNVQRVRDSEHVHVQTGPVKPVRVEVSLDHADGRYDDRLFVGACPPVRETEAEAPEPYNSGREHDRDDGGARLNSDSLVKHGSV